MKKPAQIPQKYWQKLEAKARQKRLKTGEQVRWTDILWEILEKL